MSSPSTLHFPDADTIVQYLDKHLMINNKFYQESGITKAIAGLAAKRFSNKEIEEKDIKRHVESLITHLKIGKDCFTGECLPNLGELDLSYTIWDLITQITVKVLKDCVDKVIS